MNYFKQMMVGVMLTATVTTATAGGILTNTNQSIDFLRNPARDAAISLDGVYSNPAGVAFLPEGFHIGFNWQYAHQTRTINSTSPYFALGRKNNGQTAKTFEGVADAPFIPSLQAAYNTGDWSIQLNLSVPGGGGKCEFADGLGSFENVVGNIANQLKPFGAEGYDMDGYMQGRQYYFGVQLGTAYKINEHLAVYGGLRLLYGTATYKAKISNIMVNIGEDRYMSFSSFLQATDNSVNNSLKQVNDGMAQYEAAGATASPQYADLVAKKAQLEGARQSINSLQKYSQGVNLLCNQSSVGIAPIIGIDYKIGNFNFAAKYEFKTEIRMKNESTVNEASEIAAVNKFRDGEEVSEDAPAQLALGVQWSPIEDVRINAGWHHFFDKSASWYNNAQDLLDHDSNEFLAGVEWDLNDRLTVSGGFQLTRYGLTDKYMNDMSFVVDSYSVGFGFNYKATDQVTLKAGYFLTDYDHYKRVTSTTPLVSDDFTRTNRVLGLGCEISL
jgi:long-subunit fatty acid transport protein